MNKNDISDYNCFRIILAVLHILVLSNGIGLIVLGICLHKEVSNLGYNEDKIISGLIITLVILGCILIPTGIIGILGVHDNGHFKLTVCSFLLILLIISQFTCGISAVALRRKIYNTYYRKISKYVSGYYRIPRYQRSVDFMQMKLQCCGIKSPYNYPWYIPDSCYTNYKLNKKGCSEAMGLFFQKYLLIILAVNNSFACFQLFPCILGFVLAKRFQSAKDTENLTMNMSFSKP
ncbi:hypothetical protein PHET_06435 [Paragonimus heterotremus]|uniref:Tetraspanin n=1 Tax=Paragonimus heterotremus TaxID=100268 RepID=A0A8J4T021_9TREM|nr:hypothetical protein PHET_06435 [Paragonimus heterotremus]